MDELAVVPGEAEEPAHRPGRTRRRPVVDRLHLAWVHGHARRGDDMAEVGDGGRSKGTLGALDEKLVSAQLVEDGPEMAKMVYP